VYPLAAGYGQQHTLAAHRGNQPGQQMRPDVRPRIGHVDEAVGRLVGVRARSGQQRPVDAVPGHQPGGLLGERLGFGLGHPVAFGHGQQLADPFQQRAVRLRLFHPLNATHGG